jgi:hypothetical protein
MLPGERQSLSKAVETLKTKWIKSQVDIIYSKYFSDVSKATIKSILKDPKKIFSALPATRKALLNFYIHDMRENSDMYRLYHLLLQRFGRTASDQKGFERYVGIYRFYRSSSVGEKLISGELSFDFHKDLDIPYFNTSQQLVDFSAGAELYQTDHDGPVFMFSNRMYVMGVGENYMRQMILRRVDDLKREPLTGILLTERFPGNEPLAVRLVMYHKNFVGQSDQGKILSLIGDEEAQPEILGGWHSR